jgi:hypothetical protein
VRRSAEMFREAFYTEISEPYAHALGRMWMICQHGFPAAAAAARRGPPFDFAGQFEARLRFPFEAMLALGFAILTHYSAEDNHKLFTDPIQFVTRPRSLYTLLREEHRPQADRIFEYLSLTWDEHVRRAHRWSGCAPTELMYQLFELYEHPLVRLPSGVAFVLDAYFLQQRVTEGAYWALFNSLKEDKEEGPLREAFGHATEWYVSELLRRTYASNTPTLRCTTSSQGQICSPAIATRFSIKVPTKRRQCSVAGCAPKRLEDQRRNAQRRAGCRMATVLEHTVPEQDRYRA